ncbi:hamartin [Nematostella vectensis]|nr:hamartin [Nematostella vectensis]
MNVESPERLSELISLLESDDPDTVEQTKSLINENLYKSKDPSLLNALVDCFLETRSTTVLNILTNVHEAKAHILFEKLNDCLRHGRSTRGRIDSLTLLGYVVRRQPSWLYKIVKTALFENLVKCLKSESDVLLLVNGILTITTLLPLVPASVGSWLNDLFDIFTRLAAFLTSRPGNIPDVYLLHLHVSVYNYFHRLYAMFPNNFVGYLRHMRNDKSKQILFQTTIKPMLEHVRLHPCLVTETSQTELGKHRWKKKEPQDIVIECQNISLDPVDRLQSENSLNASWTSRQSVPEPSAIEKSVHSAVVTFEDYHEIQPCEIPRLKERRMSDSATQTGKSLQSGDSGTGSMPLVSADELTNDGWSPADMCGLCTPPSSQLSPSTSNQDLSSSLTFLPISQCSTPAVVTTPGDSPTTSLAGDTADSNHGKVRRFVTSMPSGRGTVLTPKPQDSLPSSRVTTDSAKPPTPAPDTPTSTPRSGESSLTDTNRSTCSNQASVFTYDRQISAEASSLSEPATPIEKTFGESYLYNSTKEPKFLIEQEQLTCSEDIPVETAETVLRHNSFTSMELPSQPPPSLNASFSYDNTSGIPMESLVFENSKIIEIHKLNDIVTSNETVKNSPEMASCDVSKEITKSISKSDKSDKSDFECKLDSSTSTSQDGSKRLQSFSMYLSQCNCQGLKPAEVIPGIEGRIPGNTPTGDRTATVRLTPTEVLDSYLQFGSIVHHEEFSRISMISQANTDWTHFGGSPPQDEIAILRGQVQLLHHQLLYERHKCEQHAIRNRRLIGKTFKAVQYQEELQAIKDHLRLQEDKMRELTQALNKQTEDNRKLKEITSGWDNQQQTHLRNLLNENAQLQYTKGELKAALEKQKKEYEKLKLELDQSQATVFNLRREVRDYKPKLEEKLHLGAEIDKLTKELVIMGEINQQQKDLIKQLNIKTGKNPEASKQLHHCQKELSCVKHAARKHKVEVEALHKQITDLESVIKKKNIETQELKKFADSLTGTYTGKIKALEEKYAAQKKVTQSLEAHILNLKLALQDTTNKRHQKAAAHLRVETGTETQGASDNLTEENKDKLSHLSASTVVVEDSDQRLEHLQGACGGCADASS